MAFLDLFKSKPKRDMDNMLGQINEMIFPGGQKDKDRDCQRVDALARGKIPRHQLPGFVAACKSLLYTRLMPLFRFSLANDGEVLCQQ